MGTEPRTFSASLDIVLSSWCGQSQIELLLKILSVRALATLHRMLSFFNRKKLADLDSG